MSKQPLSSCSLFCIVSMSALLLTLLLFLLFPIFIPNSIDLIQYWSAAHIIMSGANPYDYKELSALQEPLLFSQGVIRIWNPPFIFPVILPFALFEFSDLRIVWGSISLGLFAGCVSLLLQNTAALDSKPNERIILYALLLTFSPLFETINWGQISIILLLAVTGWWLYYKRLGLDSFIAGGFLGLTVLKPHLFGLLYFFLLLTSIYKKKYSLITGFVTTVSLLTIIVLCIDNQIFTYYWHALSQPPIYWRNPNLGSLLQSFFPHTSPWIRSIPILAGVITLVLLFLRDRSTPRCFGPIERHWTILPISLALAPYGWIYDQIVLLPFIIELFVFMRIGTFVRIGKSLLLLLAALQINALYTPATWGQEIGLLPLLAYVLISIAILYKFTPIQKHVLS